MFLICFNISTSKQDIIDFLIIFYINKRNILVLNKKFIGLIN